MAEIKLDNFAGGAGIQETHGTPGLAVALRDVADDLVLVQATTIASPDASDLASAITLVNEIKAALNVIAGSTISTTKG